MHFIAFEGLDGSGKGTLIRLLSSALAERSIVFCLTREPGGTPLAEEIRNLLLRVGNEEPSPRAELLLYEAARAQHVDRVIKPALARGEWAICDRFIASTVAFQSRARGLDRASVDWLNTYAIDGAQPHLTVLLDLPVEVSAMRRKMRGEESDRLENEDQVFHESVRAGYLEQAQAAPRSWLTLDATAAPEALFALLSVHLRALGWWE